MANPDAVVYHEKGDGYTTPLTVEIAGHKFCKRRGRWAEWVENTQWETCPSIVCKLIESILQKCP